MKMNRWLTIAGLLGLTIPTMPATADGILSQMEDEVAAIARRAKSAVVTIEDARALMVSYDTSPLEKADIANRIAHLQIDLKAQNERLSIAEGRYRSGLTTALEALEARHQSERTAAQLAAEQRKLEQFGHVSSEQRKQLDTEDALALLAIDKKAAETQLNHEESRYRAGLITAMELEDARVKLAQVDQDIAAQNARRDLLRQSANDARNVTRDAPATPTNAYFAYTTAVLNMQQADANANAPRSGTGFSIGEGFIVTTADVLQDMQNPVVITDSGAQIRAIVVAVDGELNVGLVKLVAHADIPALHLGDSTRVMPGHFAISIGNQHGNNNAIALNLIAGVRTDATYSGQHFYPSLIQIGGTVGAGTSGAPLLNSSGEVIGIMAGVPQAEPETRTWYTNGVPQPLGTYLPLLNGNATASALASNLQFFSQPVQLAKGNKSVHPTATRPEANRVAGRKPAVKHATNKTKILASGAKLKPHAPHWMKSQSPTGFGNSRNSVNNTRNYTLANHLNLFGAVSPNFVNPGTTLTRNLSYMPMAQTAPAPPVVTSAGFAIPISEVQAVLADMKAGKSVVHGWIGVDLDNQERGTEKDGIVTVLRTVKVKSVYSGSPANRGGILPGDTLVSLDGHPLHTTGDVRAAIVKTKPGTPVKLLIDRNGQSQTLDVTVDLRPADIGAVIVTPSPPLDVQKPGGHPH
jgi:S1-C subfamily serine protease